MLLLLLFLFLMWEGYRPLFVYLVLVVMFSLSLSLSLSLSPTCIDQSQEIIFPELTPTAILILTITKNHHQNIIFLSLFFHLTIHLLLCAVFVFLSVFAFQCSLFLSFTRVNLIRSVCIAQHGVKYSNVHFFSFKIFHFCLIYGVWLALLHPPVT